MPINQLSTSNTFQQWLIATQVLIEKSNYYDERTNLVFDTANTISNTSVMLIANAAVVNAQTATVNAQTALVLSTASNVYATYANTIIQAGYVSTNLSIALNTSNSIISTALNTSNSIVSAGQNTSNSIISNSSNTANSVISNASNTANSFISNSLNTANIIVNSANSFANTVNVTAQNAYNTSNAALATAQTAANLIYTVQDDVTTDITLYPALFASNTGTPNTAVVSTTKLYYNPSTGQLSATNFDSLSDENKKDNIETIKNAVELVMNLRGVTFTWKENGYKSMGLIAQEVESIIPEVVMTNGNGEKSVTYGSLIGLLVEAIKDLNKQVVEIKSIINKQ